MKRFGPNIEHWGICNGHFEELIRTYIFTLLSQYAIIIENIQISLYIEYV